MNSKPLKQILVQEIADSSEGRITFARYMDLALYHPEHGYYNSPEIVIGKRGDFFTSSSLGRDFGELLAVQFEQMWHNLDCPDPFYLVEMGAGNGELAQDILNYFESENNDLLIKALKYIIVEQSPVLAITQKELLKTFAAFDLSWKTLLDIVDDSIVGCFFSNELVDAFPVHLVAKDGDLLREIYISLDREELTESIHPISRDQISEYFDLVKLNLFEPQYPSNYRTEVNLNALDWLSMVSNKLNRGYILTIDYGYTANKYYRPNRDRGTLQCYFQHRRHNNPYANLGSQDITTHVDFTALENQGKLCDLENIGFIQQGLFLMALGLGDRLNELSSGKYDIGQIFQRRDALHQLIDPTGLGNFGVLIQGKNLTKPEKSLRGLTIPPI